MKIAGYMVVEKEPIWGSYRGLDRNPWSKLADEYYKDTLSPQLRCIKERIYKNSFDFTGLETTLDLQDALAVARWLETESVRAEIIGIASPELIKRKGGVWQESFELLGYDVYAFGAWSLIASGLVNSRCMEMWKPKLNGNLLFDAPADIANFIVNYEEYANRDELEPTGAGDETFPVEPVAIILPH